MTVKADRSTLLKIAFYVTTVITFMIDIYPTQGLRWVNTPSDITICPDETLYLTWEYVNEENEDIRQFQWRFNSSTLIAYRGVGNGLHIEPKYHGRVNESGVTGIMLKNVTAKDKGRYSLYIIIAWKDTPVIHSMWLNVIDAEAVPIPQWCTCERLPISQEWNGRRNFNFVTDGCILEVNSSHCCIREPVNRCTDNNPQDLCRPFPGPISQIENITPVRNTNPITENDNQNRLVSEGPKYKYIEVNTDNTVLVIALSAAIIIIFLISLVLIVICTCWYWRKHHLRTKECRKANIEPAGQSEPDEEQRTPMLTDRNELKMEPFPGNQEINEKEETSQLGSVSRLSEGKDYNDVVTILKEVQYQRRILQDILTSEPRHNMRIRTNLEAHSDMPEEKPRNRDLVFSGNRPHVVEANEKWRNNKENQNIRIKLRNNSYDSSDSNNKRDAQLTYDVQFDDKPKSRSPIQRMEEMESTRL